MRWRAFGRARNERGGREREVTSLRCARGAGGKNREWARLEAAPPEVARAWQAHGKLSICLHAAAISHGGQGAARPTSPIQPDKCECLDFTLYWTMRKTASNGQPQYSPCRPFHLHRRHNPIADPSIGRHPPLGGGRMLARTPYPEYRPHRPNPIVTIHKNPRRTPFSKYRSAISRQSSPSTMIPEEPPDCTFRPRPIASGGRQVGRAVMESSMALMVSAVAGLIRAPVKPCLA